MLPIVVPIGCLGPCSQVLQFTPDFRQLVPDCTDFAKRMAILVDQKDA